MSVSCELMEEKVKAEYPRLDDPNDRSALKIDLPSLPSDHRQYRLLRLENGLIILLIENPITVSSQALLRVNAGSYDEPKAFPGLAHFLEHMLFMGSTKYPDEKEYHQYIKTHSGSYNAYTEEENTDFSFGIETEHLEPVLDRLSQFFISPLLKSDAAEREIEAIEHEFGMKLENDFFRFQHVNKRFLNPEHPESRFNHGNRETLKDITKILPALWEFYHEYYKANNMTLVLESQNTLDVQEQLVRTYFSIIPSSQKPIQELPQIPCSLADAFLCKYTQESIQHCNFIGMSFVFTLKQTLENEAALMYIKSLLSNTSPGGLFDYLKSLGYVTNVSNGVSFFADYDIDDDLEQNLEINLCFPLTQAGIDRTDEIVRSTLDYMYFLQKNGIKECYFKELQNVNQLAFDFDASNLMRSHSAFIDNLDTYPLENFFIGNAITKTTLFPEQAIHSILASFSPNMLQVYLVEDKKLLENYEIEPYTGAKFKREKVSAAIEFWHAPKEASTELPFYLPPLSPYIPQEFSIKPILPQFKMPTLIYDDNRLRAWLSQDHHFEKPIVQTFCYLISEYSNNTPEAQLCLRILFLMVNMELNKQIGRDLVYAQVVASFGITASKGPQLNVGGFSDKHTEIVLKIFKMFKNFEFIESHFIREKKTVKDGLLSHDTKQAYTQICARVPNLFNDREYLELDLLKLIDNLDIKVLQEYHQNLIRSAKVEVVCHGNMMPHEVIELGKRIRETLDLNDVSVAFPQAKSFPLSVSGNFHYAVECEVKGNALVLYLMPEDPSCIKIKYLCMMLANILNPLYFHRLRTEEQLAYLIQCSAPTGRASLAFLIESSEYSTNYLLARTEAFLEQAKKDIDAISEEAFEANKKALNNTLSEIEYPRSPSDFCSIFISRFQEHKYRFNQIFEILKVSADLSLSALKELYATLIHPSSCRQMVVRTEDKNWNETDLRQVIEQNFTEHAIRIISIIFGYTESIHKPYSIINDIPTFREKATKTREYMKEGEQYIQSLLEFNSALSKEDMANGHIVDDTIVKNTFEKTALNNCPQAIEKILTFCFRHSKMKEDAPKPVTIHLPVLE